MSAPAVPAAYRSSRGRGSHGPAGVALRALWRDPRITGPVQHLGEKILLAMNGAGELPAHVDRRELMSRCKISAATFARRIKVLAGAGYIEREYVGRWETRAGHWSHCLVIRLAEAYRWRPAREAQQAPVRPQPRVPDPQAADLPNYPGASARSLNGFDRTGPPVSSPADRIARAREDEDRDRADLIGAWPRLARARSDVPMLRPGYADRYTVRNETCVRCGRRGHVGAWCPERTLVVIDDLPY